MIDPHVRRAIARQTDDLVTKDGLGPTGMDGLAAAYPKQGNGWAATRGQLCVLADYCPGLAEWLGERGVDAGKGA